jgi:hypothetical protein
MDQVEPTEEQTVTISANDEGAPVQLDPSDGVNLVPQLLTNAKTKEWLESTIREHSRLVKEDEEGRKDYMRTHAEILKQFCGRVDPLPYPAEGAPGSHDPILTRTILLMVSRGWDQICPAKGSIINVHANGAEDEEAAQRRNDHMNWQFREKIPNYILSHRASYNAFALFGSTFRVKWWNPVTRCTQFDYITTDDMIVPYTRKDIDPLMRDVPRYTRLRRYHRFQLEALGREGYYHEVSRLFGKDVPQSSPDGDEDESDVQRIASEVDGVERPVTFTAKKGGPRILHDVYTWLQLPGPNGEPEGDQKPVILTYDKWSKLPLSLVVREEDDPFDRARFDADMAAFEMAQQNATAQYEQGMVMWEQAQAQGIPVEPPQEPVLPDPPAPVRKRPEYTVIHYRCFDNPEGFYGLGLGHLLLHPVKFINALSNDYVLAGKFANMQGGFLPKGALGPKRGEIKYQHGKFVETELDSSDMAGIKPLQFPGPSESLWKVIKETKNDAGTMVANVDTMSGEAGPTNETRTAALQRQAQASQLMGSVVRGYLEAMKEEPKMVAHDNSLFLDDREMYWVTEPNKEDPRKMERTQREIRREDYASPIDFSFTADQRYQTQPERVSTSTSLIDRLVQSPYAADPERGPPLFHAAFGKLFKALEDTEMLAALGQPPQPPAPPPPPQPMAQEDENQGYFSDQDHPVLPDDPHDDHVRIMEEFQASPYWKKLSPTGRQMAERHYNQHMGYLYRGAAERQKGINVGLGGPGGNPGVGGQSVGGTPAQGAGPTGGPGAGPGAGGGPSGESAAGMPA